MVPARAGIEMISPGTAYAQSKLTPDEALRALLAGNERFAANKLTSIEHDLAALKDHTVEKQEPFGRCWLARIRGYRWNWSSIRPSGKFL